MRILPLLLAILIAGCSKAPTIIDGSSPAAFEETTAKARRDLPINERLIFDAALRNPAVVARMEATGAIPGGGTAAEFADESRKGYELVGQIVKALGITPE